MIEIWIAFGTEKDLHYVPVHEISASLLVLVNRWHCIVFHALQTVTQ